MDTGAQRRVTRSTSVTTTNITTATTTKATSDKTDQSKWVINLSKALLTQAQASLLAYGPGFTVTPRYPTSGDYIVTIEKACSTIEPNSTEELRVEIRGALKHTHPPRSNISREEVQALAELKRDSLKVILTADKGVALVIMDKPKYNNKGQELLDDKRTFKEINTDPTNKLKTKLISLLKKIKAEGGIEDQLYKKMYPTGAVAPRFYGLPQDP